MQAFVIPISEGWVDFCNQGYQTDSHPHYLRASIVSSCPPPHSRIILHPPTGTGGPGKTTAVMDDFRPQDLYNVYLPG